MGVRGVIISSVRSIIILTVIALAIYIASIITPLPYPLPFILMFVVTGIFTPIIVFLIIDLAGDILMSTGVNSLKFLGTFTARLIAPAVSIYLIITALSSALAWLNSFFNVDMVLTAVYLLILGLLVRSFGARLGDVTRNSVRGLGTAVALFGMAMLTLSIYTFTYALYTQFVIPVELPMIVFSIYVAFLYAAVATIIITAIVFLGFLAPLRPVSADMARISDIVMYTIALVGMTTSLGALVPYGSYVIITVEVALAVFMVLVGYRLLTAYLRLGEGRTRGVYSEYAVKAVGGMTINDSELINAVNEFMISGSGDGLMRYLAGLTSHCKELGAKLMGELGRYRPPYYGGLWPWEVHSIERAAMKDAELRLRLVVDAMALASRCREERPRTQVDSSAVALSRPQYTTEDGTRVYAQPTEELPVRPIEEETNQEGGESTTVRPREEGRGSTGTTHQEKEDG